MKSHSESGNLQGYAWDAKLTSILDSAGLSKLTSKLVGLSFTPENRQSARTQLENLKQAGTIDPETHKQLDSLFVNYPNVSDDSVPESKVELHGAADPVWKGDTRDPLGILHDQVVDPEHVHAESQKELRGPDGSEIHDFAEDHTPKPTEALPTEGNVISNNLEEVKQEKKESTFILPKEVRDYIYNLKSSGPTVSWFKFDILHSDSLAEVLGAVAKGINTKAITTEEANMIRSLLPKPEAEVIEPQTKIDEVNIEPEKELPKKPDFNTMATKAFDEDRIDDCLESLRQITDTESQSEEIKTLVQRSVDASNFDLAVTIAGTAHDNTYKNQLLEWIKDKKINTEKPEEKAVEVKEVDNVPENQAILDAINISDKEFGNFIFNEYTKKGRNLQDILSDVDTIKDDNIHSRILEVLIRELLGYSDIDKTLLDKALKIAENFRDEGNKETVKRIIQDLKGGPIPAPVDEAGTPPVVPELTEDPETPTVALVPVPPVTMEDAIETLSVTETAEQINAQLEFARSEYATQLTAWKNESRGKKGVFKKMMLDLGVTRSMPETDKPYLLKNAEILYIQAKKKKREGIFANKEALIADIEQERELVLRRISEGQPPLEKGLLGKGLEVWSKMSPAKRIAISSVLLGLGSLALGATVGVAAVAAGTRAARAGASMFTGQVAGKSFDILAKRSNKKIKNATLESYTTSLDEATFEEKERELMEAMERMDTREKRQRLGKAMAMVAGAGALTLGSYMSDDIPTGVKSNTGDGLTEPALESKPAVSTVDSLKPESSHGVTEVTGSGGTAGSVEGNLTPLKVELSSKGFIQDIHNLKAKVLEQYGSMDRVPPSLKENLMDKSSMGLAKELGFYDAETGQSGMGLKGESLGLDAKGNIVYEHAGKTDVVFNAETDAVAKFGGKMFAPKVEVPQSEVPQEATLDLQDNTRANFVAGAGTEFQDKLGGKPEISFEDQVARNMRDVSHARSANPLSAETGVPEPISVSTPEVPPSVGVTWNDSHEVVLLNGEKTRALDDMFQDGEQFKEARKAFAEQFNKNIKPEMNIALSDGFESGRIDIVRTPSTGASQVLLNGKEIAKGYIVPGQNSIKPIDGLGIKTGFFGKFFSDSVYDRAFEAAKKMAETLSKNPNIIPKK